MISRAAAAVVVTPAMKRAFARRIDRDYDVVMNGFDPADFPPPTAAPDVERGAFVLHYAGNVSGARSPDALWSALARLDAARTMPHLKVRFVGKIDAVVRERAEAAGVGALVEVLPYVPHAEAVAGLRRAALLLLLINRVDGAEGIMTGKLFEYLASGRPVVGLGPGRRRRRRRPARRRRGRDVRLGRCRRPRPPPPPPLRRLGRRIADLRCRRPTASRRTAASSRPGRWRRCWGGWFGVDGWLFAVGACAFGTGVSARAWVGAGRGVWFGPHVRRGGSETRPYNHRRISVTTARHRPGVACRLPSQSSDLPMTIISVVGARPQFVKAAIVSRALALAGVEERLVHTGQHYDAAMSDVFFDELGMAPPAVNLAVGSGRHGAQTARTMEGFEAYLVEAMEAGPVAGVVVYGDTNATLGAALVAAKLAVPLAHVEAGLRSFVRAMPEEINRVVTDRLSDLCLCPTEAAVAHLAAEGIAGEGVVLCGDVMLEATRTYADEAAARAPLACAHRPRVGRIRPRHRPPRRQHRRSRTPSVHPRGPRAPRAARPAAAPSAHAGPTRGHRHRPPTIEIRTRRRTSRC